MREWLRNARNERNLTLKELAEKLDISESYLSTIETLDRKKKLDIELVQKLSKALKMPIKKIIEFENQILICK